MVSRKTGTVYEKRLIIKYLEENGGHEPNTSGDDELDPEQDLLEIKTSRVVRPRPPAFTSLPSMLKAFQDEWDALVLESYTTREQLARTREELATALYQHDAAVRVIARLTRERDEARDALSKVTVTASGAGGQAAEDAMSVDNESLPESLAEHVDELQAQLTKGRKKRPIPAGWATGEEVAALQQVASSQLTVSKTAGGSSLALSSESDYASVGGLDARLDIYSLSADAVERTLEVGEPVSADAWTGSKVIVATTKGSVKVYDGGAEAASFSEHAGAVTGLSVHPGKRLLASVGVDKAFIFYDLETLQRVSRVYTDSQLTSCAFHPDGHLFAAGTASGDVKIFDTKSGQLAATFSLSTPSPVISLVFSENGFWFAAAAKSSPIVTIFDLRKEGDAARVKEIDVGGEARGIDWDYTGQFLAVASPAGVSVQQYIKSSKSWVEPLRAGKMGAANAVKWGSEAKQLVVLGESGAISVLGEKA